MTNTYSRTAWPTPRSEAQVIASVHVCSILLFFPCGAINYPWARQSTCATHLKQNKNSNKSIVSAHEQTTIALLHRICFIKRYHFSFFQNIPPFFSVPSSSLLFSLQARPSHHASPAFCRIRSHDRLLTDRLLCQPSLRNACQGTAFQKQRHFAFWLA